MAKRTIKNCSLIKKWGEEPPQSNGKCDGYAVSEYNDEPYKICKKCKLNTWYEEDKESDNNG